MGLMRRVESRVERSVGAAPRESVADEPGRGRPRRDAKYYVQPGELARKLVKEMEDHKVSHSAQGSVCNRYTVFLCAEDYARLQSRQDEIVGKLQRHLLKHVGSKKYAMPGDLTVVIVRDDDLALGKFGVLAERLDTSRPFRAPVSAPEPVRRAAAQPAVAGGRGTTVIPPAQAAELGLAHHTIVVKAGNRVREFNKGRVVVGRARDADFRVDDSNVSRRHAAIYWDDGRIMVQDLESTNGTMVNGYPVTTTVLRPTDVLVIGECRITVEIR
jgi:hypothetical protein